jgi:hypothetical protein
VIIESAEKWNRTGSMLHTLDIYEQMAVYLRLNGIVPPASRRGGL